MTAERGRIRRKIIVGYTILRIHMHVEGHIERRMLGGIATLGSALESLGIDIHRIRR
jgi:hypothetical protein